jgi:HAD superfamily hydrolase (TIGR01509 family)
VIRAVLFDCDGTLVDSEPIWLATLNDHIADHIAAWPGSPAVPLRFADIEGQSMARSLQRVEARLGHPLPPGFETVVRADMARRFETALCEMPGATELLRGLRLPCCVASNGPRSKIALVLRLTGLDRFFPPDRVFSAVELGRYKPDPALFLQAAEALGVAPAECAVVEDSRAGIEAGLRAGMRVYAYLPHAPLRPEDAVRGVQHLPHLSHLRDI